MVPPKESLPEGWEKAQRPKQYYFNNLKVKAADRGRGMYELVTRKNGKRVSAFGSSIRSAMESLEDKLTR